MAVAAFALPLLGLGLVYKGLADADPLTWSYTSTRSAPVARSRTTMLLR